MDKKALFNLGYGLYVLTAKTEKKHNGCIVNTVMQVSDMPATIMVGVNKNNYTCDMIKETGKFNISVLNENAKFDLFKHFGFQSGRDVDKFEKFENKARSINGLYYITEGTNAFISAEVINVVEVETHMVFVARITDCGILNNVKSATYAFYHSNIKPQQPINQDNLQKADGTNDKKENEEEKNLDKKKKFLCEVCGYVYEGDELPKDFVCPLCKHGADAFVEI